MGQFEAIDVRQGNLEGPVTGELETFALAKGVFSDGHAETVKAKIRRGALDGGPAVLGGFCGGEPLLQAVQSDSGIEVAAKHSFKEHSGCGSELSVAQAPDTDGDEQAKGDDDNAGELGLHDGDGADGSGHTGSVEREGDPTGGEASLEKAVMDVAAVGGEDGLPSQEPSSHDEGGIEKRDEERQERGGHPQDGGGFLAPENAVAAEQETEEEAAGVSQEDRGRTEVVAQESEECTDQGRSGKGERNVGLEERGDQHGGSSEDPETGGEAIDAIDQIERIGTKNEPPDGQRKTPADPNVISGDTRQVNAGPERASGSHDLSDEFLPRAEAKNVVQKADREDDDARRQEAPCQGQSFLDDGSGTEGQGQQNGVREHVSQGHRHAAAAWHWHLVKLASRVRMIDQPPATE